MIPLRRQYSKEKHLKDCTAKAQVTAGNWDSVWYVHSASVWLPHGARGRSGPWIELRCNSSTSEPCPARLYVHADSIIDLVPRW